VNVASDFEAVDVYADPAFFEITDGDVSNIEVKATHGLNLSGVLITDSISSKEVLAQLTMLRISARVGSPSNPQAAGSGSSLIAGDGSFSINGLRPGRASLYISSFGNSGIRGLTIARVERDGVDVTRTLELKTDQPISNLRVVLSYGTGTIRGMVKFENGAPPPAARLFISARREGFPNSNYGSQADSRGHFLISNLPGGTYEVSFNLGLTGPPQPGQKRVPPAKQFVTVADDAEAEVTFTIDLAPVEGGP
jgi:hypothetical protein